MDIATGEATLYKRCFVSYINKTFTIKRKECLGNKVFPFTEDLFSEEALCKGKQAGSYKIVSPL